MITIWLGMTIQGLYCYLDMGNNTVMYSKCSHVPNQLEANRSDPKKFWRIINNTIIYSNSSYDYINFKNDEGTSLTLEDYCSYMNDYLVSIGKKPEHEFSNSIVCPPNYYNRDPILNTYVITKEDVIANLKEIDISKGSGIDFIPTFTIKDAFK